MTGARQFWRVAKAAHEKATFHARFGIAGAQIRRERRRRLLRRAATTAPRPALS